MCIPTRVGKNTNPWPSETLDLEEHSPPVFVRGKVTYALGGPKSSTAFMQ